MAKLVGHNVRRLAMGAEGAGAAWDGQVSMWVHEEVFEGRKLSELINETHENPKFERARRLSWVLMPMGGRWDALL